METSLSLLQRLREKPAEVDWQRLVALYEPLIRGWLLREPALRAEADDLVQDVLAVLVRELPQFERRRTGSFRAWLRVITVNRARQFWRARQARPDFGAASAILDQLEDPNSEQSRIWEREHDEHVARRLVELLQPEFSEATWTAFRMQVLEGRNAAETAGALGVSVNAVLVAKSRVLARFREEARGLLGA